MGHVTLCAGWAVGFGSGHHTCGWKQRQGCSKFGGCGKPPGCRWMILSTLTWHPPTQPRLPPVHPKDALSLIPPELTPISGTGPSPQAALGCGPQPTSTPAQILVVSIPWSSCTDHPGFSLTWFYIFSFISFHSHTVQ